MSTPLILMSSRQPLGVHEMKPVFRLPEDNSPRLRDVMPSTSFRHEMRSVATCALIWLVESNGSCKRHT